MLRDNGPELIRWDILAAATAPKVFPTCCPIILPVWP